MIREFIFDDIDSINVIGKQIKDNFSDVEKLQDINNKNYRKLYVYVENNNVIGFLQIENHFEITDIINIAVSVEKHNKGIATKLIDYLVSVTEAEKLMLEVRENNESAISFYKKNGFKEISRRKKYYGNEDAIIMERVM